MPCNGCGPRSPEPTREEQLLIGASDQLCDLFAFLEGSGQEIKGDRLRGWWEYHKKKDRERVRLEVEAKNTKLAKAQAISKLTPYERKLLRL